MTDTLLGVPRDTLLRAMEIVVHVRWKNKGSSAFDNLQRDKKGWYYVDRRGDHNIPAHIAATLIEHAFREWLRKRKYIVYGHPYITQVWALDDKRHIAEHEHYLTALAMAVCKIGETK